MKIVVILYLFRDSPRRGSDSVSKPSASTDKPQAKVQTETNDLWDIRQFQLKPGSRRQIIGRSTWTILVAALTNSQKILWRRKMKASIAALTMVAALLAGTLTSNRARRGRVMAAQWKSGP